MIRLVLEIVVAVILAITATLSFVSFKQGKDVQKQVVEAKKEIGEVAKRIDELEAAAHEAHAAAGKAHETKHEGPHWAYEGEMGPDKWGSMKGFETCGTGKAQSPIDLKEPFAKTSHVIRPDYKPGALTVLNNGHTIQVNIEPGSRMFINSEPFDLLQFHFHRPSEEHINGKPMDMVAHFVHKSASGKLAVLGVLLREGGENQVIKTIWDNAPVKEGPPVTVSGVTINPANLLPTRLGYWAFEGSLTTPPCTEGVTFFILKTPTHIGRAQVDGFPFKLNARPVQPLNGRQILTN